MSEQYLLMACRVFIKNCVYSENKCTFLNAERRSDHIDGIFNCLVALFSEKKDFKKRLNELYELCRQVQDDYVNLLLVKAKGVVDKKELDKVNRSVQAARLATPQVALPLTEDIIRAFDGTVGQPHKLSFDKSGAGVVSKKHSAEAIEEVEAKISIKIQQFLEAYTDFATTTKRYKKGCLHCSRPFMLEFYNFFTHYAFATIVNKKWDVSDDTQWQKGAYVYNNLDRAERHLHRGVLDIYKIIVIIHMKNHPKTNWDKLRDILKARHVEVHNTSNSIDRKIALYKNAIDALSC